MLTRRARALCLLAGGAGLAGCATTEEQVTDGLQARLDADHDGHLERRALASYSTGAAALEALDPDDDALQTSTGPGSVSLVVPISVRRIDGGRLSYRETPLGMDGGETSVANSGLVCERHHTKVHHGFRIERDPGGRWHTYRPDGTEILIGTPLLV